MTSVPQQPRRKPSVAQELFFDASRFTFLQAVRLLEQMRPGFMPPGEGVSPRHELVMFRHAVRLDFPATDVEHISAPAQGDTAPSMTTNVLGLTGAQGPLPHHITEQVLGQTLRGDHAARNFLDIFNHRLISLLYRARKKYRPALDPRGPEKGRVATVLHSLMGLGSRHLRGRLGIDDRVLLPYAGLLSDATRSSAGLERILAHCFGLDRVVVIPFQGQWHEVEEEDRTRIGESGTNQLLGQGAMLGKRMWDQAAGIEVRLGPLTYEQFHSFLPGSGHAYKALVSIIRFYLREELGFSIRLVVQRREVPRLRLSRRTGPRLGYTSWLNTGVPERDDAQVKVPGRA